MTASWSDILSSSQLYWGISIIASVLQVFLLIGAFIGGGSDFDHGADSHDGSTADSVKILSLRILVAFFVGFGWMGVLAQRQHLPPSTTVLMAAGSGVVFMALMFVTMRMLMTMRHDGSLRYENAIGIQGKVYVTIPPARSGVGQIEVMLQGRLITAEAVTDAPEALPPRSGIQITSLMPPNTFVVKPAPL
ncbi:MAG TPA: hypothetical protein VGE39_21850 [Prosthecobacter sp.]